LEVLLGVSSEFAGSEYSSFFYKDYVDASFGQFCSHHATACARTHNHHLTANLGVAVQLLDDSVCWPLDGFGGMGVVQAVRGVAYRGLDGSAPDVNGLHNGEKQSCSLSD